MTNIDRYAISVHVLDGNGNVVNFTSGGGVSMVDDAAFTPATSSFTPSGGIVTSDSVDSGDGGAFAMTTARVQLIGGDLANDDVDAGYPLKVGGKAQNAPTAVADGDRSNLWTNRLGAVVISADGPGNAGSDTVTNVTFPSLRTASAAGSANVLASGAYMYDGSTNWVRARGDTTNGMWVNVKAAAATPVTDNSGSLTVDAPVGTPVFVRLSNGSSAITTLPVSLASLPALAAGTNLVGRVSSSDETSTIYNATTALTPKFAAIAAASSGDNTLISAVASKTIRILAMFVMAAGAVNVYFTSAAAGTVIFGGSTNKINLAANGGFVLPYNPAGWMQNSSVNQAIVMNLSGATVVSGGCLYVEV